MRRVLAAAAAALLLASCNSTESQRDRMLIGAGLSAATGATIGAVAGSSVGSSLAGAAIGAVGGGLIGVITAPQNCIAYDQDGTPYKVRCP
jgi:osmotically inducible lipoprotein OsmB